TQPSLGVVQGSDGSFLVSGSHSYAHPGQYLLSVNVVSPTDTATGWGTAHVATPAVDVVSHDLGLPPYGSYYGYGYYGYSNILLATFVDPAPKLTAADFTAAINWGNGYSVAASVTGSDGTFWVSATPSYYYSYGAGQYLAH